MTKTITFCVAAIAGSILISGCLATTNPYNADKQLTENPEINHLVKIVSHKIEIATGLIRYDHSCSGVSLGKGLYLTNASCLGENNHVIGLDDGKTHEVSTIKQGHKYEHSGSTVKQGHRHFGRFVHINDTDENWAILYTKDLILPPAKISNTNDLPQKQTMCAVYFTPKWRWRDNSQSRILTPIKACGNIGKHNDLIYIITWHEQDLKEQQGMFGWPIVNSDGRKDLKEQQGMFGAPVFDIAGNVTGIISYRVKDNFKQAGILPASVFRDAIKEAQNSLR